MNVYFATESRVNDASSICILCGLGVSHISGQSNEMAS